MQRGRAGVRAALRQAAALALSGGLAFCAGGKEERRAPAQPDETSAVATLDGEPVPYGAFERYLRNNAGDDLASGEQGDTIRSRLLDRFLEEQLLLRAAADLKIAVSEPEVDAYMKELGLAEPAGEGGSAEGREAFREQVRRGLVLQKIKDEQVISKVQVTPGEVEDYLAKRPDLLRESRMVVLRQILVDDRSAADRLRAEIAAEPSRFEELAREHSVAADRGEARAYREEELPEELRDPLLELEANAISPVIEHAGAFRLFQMVRKVATAPVERAEVRRRVQMELFQRKIEQVLSQYIADLKDRVRIHVNRAVLPFRYVGEHRG